MHADLLIHGGSILTLDPHRLRAPALAIADGRVLSVGQIDDLAEFRGPGTRMLDLHGACALPAFTDSHCHLIAYGLSLDEIDCSPEVAPTLEAIKTRIGQAARAVGPGEWVQARAYDDTRLQPPGHPTRRDLDAVAPHVPVILRRRCGHVCVANSVALEVAGINASGPTLVGGVIDRDDTGEPTGVLRERAQQLVRERIPLPGVESLKRAILRAANRYVEEGFCAVHDAGGTRKEELIAYRELAEEGRLPLRVALMVRDPWLSDCIEAGIATGFGGEWLRVGPCKLFADGGIGARTAAVSRSYQAEPGNLGISWYPQEELTALARKAARAGFAVAIHAIGDRAIDLAVRALEDAVSEAGPSRYPHRIEHAVLPTEEHIARMNRLGIAAAVQPAFLYTLGDSWLANLDPNLARRCYPLRAMAQAGVLLAGGSDCPVVPSDPRRGLQAAVARRTQEGREIAPDQALDALTALGLFTTLPPRLMGEEAFRGRLASGLAADVVVLSEDPLMINPAAFDRLRVLATITGGKARYESGVLVGA